MHALDFTTHMIIYISMTFLSHVINGESPVCDDRWLHDCWILQVAYCENNLSWTQNKKLISWQVNLIPFNIFYIQSFLVVISSLDSFNLCQFWFLQTQQHIGWGPLTGWVRFVMHRSHMIVSKLQHRAASRTEAHQASLRRPTGKSSRECFKITESWLSCTSPVLYSPNVLIEAGYLR